MTETLQSENIGNQLASLLPNATMILPVPTRGSNLSQLTTPRLRYLTTPSTHVPRSDSHRVLGAATRVPSRPALAASHAPDVNTGLRNAARDASPVNPASRSPWPEAASRETRCYPRQSQRVRRNRVTDRGQRNTMPPDMGLGLSSAPNKNSPL